MLLCVCVPLILLLRKHYIGAANTHATTEELLNAVFSMRAVLYRILNM
jgi:hypothetical protein